MGLNLINASAGTGEAVKAAVTVIRTAGSTVINVDSVVNWPAFFVATTGTVLANGTLNPSSILVFAGHITGAQIIIDTIAPGYTDTGSAVNNVVVIKPASMWADNIKSTLGVSMNEAGTLKTTAVQTALGITGVTPPDYNALPYNPNTVVYNGNRSYTATFTGVDLTPTLNPGTRLRTTRTVAAPTQSTLLNGTTQSLSRITTINGMTFTDDFTVGAWVKLTSYTDGTIISRYNGTSGWELISLSNGTLNLRGFNASSANLSSVISYQSIPLNKWVHISAQLDMSTFTATPTTSYITIDGVDVPAAVSRGGTNPTTLIQAGNLEIGSRNGGLQPFPGKVAQAFVTSAKLTQTQVKAIYSQGLVAADVATYSIVSAFSLSGASGLTDINTTNANNLTANGGAVTTNADSFATTQASGLINGTTDYGIIQDVQFTGGNTVVIVQVPEGCTIPTSGGVSAVSYSGLKAPYGMPSVSPVLYRALMQTGSTATSGTLQDVIGYQTPSLTIPTGGRRLKIRAFLPQTFSSVDADRMDWQIDEDGVIIATIYNRTWSNGNGGNGGTIVEVNKLATAGTHTYKLRVSRGTGTGIPSIFAIATAPGYFEVALEDGF